jgi:hypothetical protein
MNYCKTSNPTNIWKYFKIPASFGTLLWKYVCPLIRLRPSPWLRAIEKLTVNQLIMKSLIFCEFRKFITVFTTVRNWTLSEQNKSSSLHLLTYGTERFLRSCQLCSHSGTSQHFTEPESSSPCSQEPSTGPYPESDRSSPYYPTLSL